MDSMAALSFSELMDQRCRVFLGWCGAAPACNRLPTTSGFRSTVPNLSGRIGTLDAGASLSCTAARSSSGGAGPPYTRLVERRVHPRCSFCGKRQDEVRKLVAGPGVFICDQCVELCNEAISKDATGVKQTPRAGRGEEAIRFWRHVLTAHPFQPWVVFENGTCVVLREPEGDLAEQARALLLKWGRDPDFKVRKIGGHDERLVLCNHPDILNYMTADEISTLESASRGNGAMMRTTIGIMVRYRRGMDSRDLKVIHVEADPPVQA